MALLIGCPTILVKYLDKYITTVVAMNLDMNCTSDAFTHQLAPYTR